MDNKQLHETLNTISNIEIKEESLYAPTDYLDVEAGNDVATLDGDFTVEQLEAIAQWMRTKKQES